MLEIPHVLVGAGIATSVGNPLLSVPIAFLSHFALDKVPHWNPHFYTEASKNGKPSAKSTRLALVDSLFALGIGLYFTFNVFPDSMQSLNILLCCFAAVLSDQVKIPYFYFGMKRGLLKKWVDFERSIQVDTGLFWGILTQVVVSLAALWWIMG